MVVPFKVSLSLGLNFILQLNNVSLFNGSANIVPKILDTGTSAFVPVPEEAANSQVTGLLAVEHLYHQRADQSC